MSNVEKGKREKQSQEMESHSIHSSSGNNNNSLEPSSSLSSPPTTISSTALSKNEQQRSHNASTPSINKFSPFQEEISRRRRRVEFLYPKDDAVYHGKEYVFHKQQQMMMETSSTTTSTTNVVCEESEKTNGNSKQTNKRVLALLRLKEDDDDDDSTTAATTNSSGQSESHRNNNNKSSATSSSSSSSGEGRHLSGLSVEDAVRDKMGCRPRSNSTDGELNLPQRGLCDERMVLESHQWTIMYNPEQQQQQQQRQEMLPPRGFMNLGNTCFLNSTLQCLAYLPPFCQSLMALQQQSSPTPLSMAGSQPNGIKKESTGKRITWMLRSLFQQIHNHQNDTKNRNNNNNNNNYAHQHHHRGSSAIAPRAIVNALPSVGTCGSRHGYKFRLGRQEDAHEFLVYLLDAMQDGELRAAGINQHISGWRERLPVPRLDETTFVHRIFGGYLRSQVRCTSCGFLSNTYDPFLDLALEVSRQSSTSIAAALQEFTKKETLDSQNRWKCSGCHKYVCATKQLTVFRPPLALCIQMKRFSFGSNGGNSLHGHRNRGGFFPGNKIFNHSMVGRGGCKITKPIEFPLDLNLPLSDGRNCAYSLTGVVIHVGGSASSGHYTAYVKRPTSGGGFQWFHMDDSFVDQVPEKQVLRQKDAYVLFYCRKEVKLEFPAPPKSSMSTAEAKQFARARAKAASDRHEESHSESRKLQKSSIDSSTSTPSLESSPFATNSSMQSSVSSSEIAHSIGTSNDQSTLSYCSSDQSKPPSSPPNKPLVPPGRLVAAGVQPSEPSESSSSEDSGSDSGSTTSPNSKSHSSEDEIRDSKANESDDLKASPDRTTESASTASSNTVLAERNISPSSESSDSFGVTKRTSGAINQANGNASDPVANVPPKLPQQLNSKTMDNVSALPELGTISSISSTNQESTLLSRKTIPSTAPANVPINQNRERENVDATVGRHTSSASGSSASNSEIADSRSGDPNGTPTFQGGQPVRTRVVLDRGGAHGKLEVILGPRSKRTAWKPNLPNRDREHELLGNKPVGQWGDDDQASNMDEDEPNTSKSPVSASQPTGLRAQVVKQIEDSERSRKRKMHLDRWDAHLDEGRTKKIKAKQTDTPSAEFSDPKKNVFQRIQSGLQRMNHGRAKGLFHRKKHSPWKGRDKSRRSPR